jgi:hypothetical protein
MTSQRKIAANRQNARKSRGPRSAAGKIIASRNALRHGFAAAVHRQQIPEAEIDRMAKALCGSNPNPVLFEQARNIARNDLALQAISAQQIAVVERVRERCAVALTTRKRGVLKHVDEHTRQSGQAFDLASALRDHLLEKYATQLPPPDLEIEAMQCEADGLIPLYLEAFLRGNKSWRDEEEGETNEKRVRDQTRERDEAETLEEAVADLDRYERRAWSRQRRALRAFVYLKMERCVT